MSLKYLKPAQEKTLRDWWRALQPRAKDAASVGPFVMLGRADSAKLRRCQEPGDVLLESAFHRLAQRMTTQEPGEGTPRFADDFTAFALVAGVLAHVKDDANNNMSFAFLLGQTGDGDRPLLSELRFQRLQTSVDETDFYRQAIRAVKLLNGRADVVTLANDLLAWVWEYRDGHGTKPKERLKVRWASDYYRAALKLANNDA